MECLGGGQRNRVAVEELDREVEFLCQSVYKLIARRRVTAFNLR